MDALDAEKLAQENALVPVIQPVKMGVTVVKAVKVVVQVVIVLALVRVIILVLNVQADVPGVRQNVTQHVILIVVKPVWVVALVTDLVKGVKVLAVEVVQDVQEQQEDADVLVAVDLAIQDVEMGVSLRVKDVLDVDILVLLIVLGVQIVLVAEAVQAVVLHLVKTRAHQLAIQIVREPVMAHV